MKAYFSLMLFGTILAGCNGKDTIKATVSQHPRTFCNPLNLDYRFMKIAGGEGIREAADPVVVTFENRHYLFASKSSGYWHSTDFSSWTHVIIPDSVLPIEDYAPGLFVYNGYLYYAGSSGGKAMLYRSEAPEQGKWEAVAEIWSYWDPAFHVEGNLLYMYYGSSPINPIYTQVLDLNTMDAKSEVMPCFNSDTSKHGWERPGEDNSIERRPYLEGAWMTKHNDKYYLQYAAPGTEWKSYADGTYISDSPQGPFTYMSNNPVSYKPTGFIGGAGHGCLFTTDNGHYWKAATNAISVRHMFERRVSFYPAGFDKDGYLHTCTLLGDYPMYLPGSKEEQNGKHRPDWMLLSQGKPTTASSALDGYPSENMVDEDIRTAWVAASSANTEWVQIDLLQPCDVNAIQVNFDEYGATQSGLAPEAHQSYLIEASLNSKDWYTVVDNSAKMTDTPHDYTEFEDAFTTRFIRMRNVEYTVSPNLSIREIRVFGLGKGDKPAAIRDFSVERDTADACKARMAWSPADNANGYIVRFGIAEDKLYNHFQLIGDTLLNIGSLNRGVTYYFTIDTFNENGVTHSHVIRKCQ